jgi:hypothetical protein
MPCPGTGIEGAQRCSVVASDVLGYFRRDEIEKARIEDCCTVQQLLPAIAA